MTATKKNKGGRPPKGGKPSASPATEAAVAEVQAAKDDCTRVRAYLADGDVRELAVPPGRYRWDRLRQMLDAYQWLRVELLGSDGAIVSVYDHPDGGRATGLETLATATRPSAVTEVQALTSLILEAQRIALEQQLKLVEVATQAQSAALEAATGRLGTLERQVGSLLTLVRRSVSQSIELSEDAAAAIAEAAAGAAEDNEQGDQVEALKAMAIQGLIDSALKRLVAGAPAPATPPNGTPKG